MAVSDYQNVQNYEINRVFKKGDVNPFIISFQNGQLKANNGLDFNGGLYLDTSSKEQKHAIISLDNMLYLGNEQQDSGFHNLIIARNRKTGDVRLIEASKAVLKALPELELNQAKEGISSQDASEFTRNELSEAFGSKRQKRILEQSKKMKIDIDTMKEQLEKTINEKQIDILEISEHNVHSDILIEKYAPPMNKEAHTVKDVYQVNNFLTEEQLDTLKETANQILEDESYKMEISDYIKNRITELRKSQNEDKTNPCSLLLYADCIIRYLKEPYKKVSNIKYTVCSYSESINNAVLDTFSMCSDKGRTRPQSLKDKSICYVIVILLLVSNYILSDIKELSKAIGVTLPKLTQMSKVIGAHYSSDAKNPTIVLKLPLAQPPSVRVKRSRK